MWQAENEKEKIRLEEGEEAPDFELADTQGKLVRLSSFRGKEVVLLAFLRGFM